jgi:hypothetical protein
LFVYEVFFLLAGWVVTADASTLAQKYLAYNSMIIIVRATSEASCRAFQEKFDVLKLSLCIKCHFRMFALSMTVQCKSR